MSRANTGRVMSRQGASQPSDVNNSGHSQEQTSADGNPTKQNPLDFGWFSLPPSNEVPQPASNRCMVDGAEDGGVGGTNTARMTPQVPPSRAGYQAAGQTVPPSRAGYQAAGQTVPPSRAGYQASGQTVPPSRAGYQAAGQASDFPSARPMSQAQHALGDPTGFAAGDPHEYGAQGCEGYAPNQGANLGQGECADENVIIDWPLSRAAQDTVVSAQGQRATDHQQQRRPASRAIPPTPMPPLSWGGYNSSARPTFASWRDQWHQAQDSGHPRGSQSS
ncbi:uncharacterized protein LOC131928529 [Physella acuta]|uniref:uncharacterized protein LOC131928529 n=1 Tax=Physella acuta TaxID=109671 RepID=UPI0027DC82D3|nr:uncharacterized protein LOC131928529 [Physella acuta]